ncbi:unnamed protein product [Pleuronectes platessa]|uniref:Uncharacterized protein n=1 Tax=Pleuronectes platessa TaxID=8262 RepID=A0A9N7U911_PLEPL|nr:unnamed protein product [Pleuronectes platessa]
MTPTKFHHLRSGGDGIRSQESNKDITQTPLDQPVSRAEALFAERAVFSADANCAQQSGRQERVLTPASLQTPFRSSRKQFRVKNKENSVWTCSGPDTRQIRAVGKWSIYQLRAECIWALRRDHWTTSSLLSTGGGYIPAEVQLFPSIVVIGSLRTQSALASSAVEGVHGSSVSVMGIRYRLCRKE